MAGKRTASSELNHDNWDEEYETEEAGTFKRASEDVIQRRVIKTAKRRNPISSVSSETNTKNIFSTFGGFKKNTSQESASPFAFLSNFTNTSQNNSNGLNKSTSKTSITTTSSNSSAIFKIPENITPSSSTNNLSDEKKNPSEKSSNYYAKLKGLNESVSQWIQTHVDKNPLCILTPIFKDYEKYLLEIESSKDDAEFKTGFGSSLFKLLEENKTSQPSSPGSSLFNSPLSKSSENPFLSKPIAEEKPKEVSSPASKPTTTATTGFTFGSSTKLPTATNSGFSFGSGTPFTFSNVAKPATAEEKTEEANEDEDEPPKVEFKPVVEDGHIFSKRCKVFVKKDGEFADRGVGQLFLKPVEGSEKIQLIVRNETSLGKLLMNIILSQSMPMQRMGKNNVMLVCVPTPDAKAAPTPVLLRVKTAEEADELLNVLEKHRK